MTTDMYKFDPEEFIPVNSELEQYVPESTPFCLIKDKNGVCIQYSMMVPSLKNRNKLSRIEFGGSPSDNTFIQGDRFTRSNVPHEFVNKGIKEFKTSLYNNTKFAEESLKAACTYIRKFKELDTNLYIYSKSAGSGRTMMGSLILNEIMKRYNMPGKYILMPMLINELKKQIKQDDPYNQKNSLRSAIDTPLLLLDDLGDEVNSKNGWVDEILLKILNEREKSKSLTIYISRFTPDQLKYNKSMISRIKNAITIELPDENIRENFATANNIKFEKLMKEIT
ncbi:hypothetical protein Clole_1480 [Cellulosilyticum lentocellum DSM 5427]|uniref:Uncharacterized protein n=1 Tax=Cellulosilyticum lentocellum (strain ATCC 49066 / DSM 5427 / NCIMB 11756 / RHM5) TaxID=642492 RepID=F2JJ47_CELLD|nr:hypothetical protein Clole_1480 [Cellulosilyticum lentocellum DSM 5427]